MRRPVLALAALVLAAPVAAQEERGLVERGVETLMAELLRQMAPALRDLEGTVTTLEGVISEIENYEAPVILPNGDILIRRKPDLGPGPAPDADIEL
jgi:hypothetical protein